MTPERILTFGDFRLDPVSGHLYRGQQIVALAPKAFALLQFLAGQAGRLVSKQELLGAVWPGVFVGDDVLKSTIRELRKALGDHSSEPRFIETAHRRGYRFMAAVNAIEPPSSAVTPNTPRVSYAHSGNVNIAYQVIGSGPIDLVFVMGWVSHLEYFWNEPSFARFLTRLSSRARLILFDKRGTGPGATQRIAVARHAARRCARGDGGRRQPTGRADGRIRGRSALQPVCRDLPREDRSADHDRQLCATDVGPRLPMGPDTRGSRSLLPDDHR